MFLSIFTAFAILRGRGNSLGPQVGHFLIQQNEQLNVFLWILIILGNFTFLKNRGNFSSPQAGLASFLLHFSNSAICQTMPEKGTGQLPTTQQFVQALGPEICCWATAPGPGQLPLWIFEHYVATSNISSMSLTVIGAPANA